MTTDEIQLLRDFRSDIPEPDENTVRQAYAYATSQSRRARWLRLHVPTTNRGRILGIVVAASAATLIGLFAVPGSSPHHASTQRAGNAPATPFPVGDASKEFGAPVILPNTSLLQPSDAASTAYEQWCPAPTPGASEPLCQVDVQFPAQAATISYSRWPPVSSDPLADYQAQLQTSTDPGKQIVYLSGIPALLLPKDVTNNGSSIEFMLGKVTITVFARNYDGSQTQELAQSIVDQAARTNS